MQDLHFLSLLALPAPCIFKSLTAFLVLNINRILSREFTEWGSLPEASLGDSLLLLLGGQTCGSSPHPIALTQSTHRPSCSLVCPASSPSSLGIAPHFPLENRADPP